MPKISALMPIYNTPKEYLTKTIESILSQTFTDFELIILNDSPNNKELEKIVKSYKDKRIKYLSNEKNIGITPSRNKLINLAKGEYIAIIDHDDISIPTRFYEEATYLDNNPDVGVVSGQIQYFQNNHGKSKHKIEDADIKINLLNSIAVSHPCAMIRKSILTENNIQYDEKFTPAEDYKLWIDLIPYTKFHNIDKVLLLYRDHKENTAKVQNYKINMATAKLRSILKEKYSYLYEYKLLTIGGGITLKLLGFLPILSIKKYSKKIKVYLFNKILILTIKYK